MSYTLMPLLQQVGLMTFERTNVSKLEAKSAMWRSALGQLTEANGSLHQANTALEPEWTDSRGELFKATAEEARLNIADWETSLREVQPDVHLSTLSREIERTYLFVLAKYEAMVELAAARAALIANPPQLPATATIGRFGVNSTAIAQANLTRQVNDIDAQIMQLQRDAGAEMNKLGALYLVTADRLTEAVSARPFPEVTERAAGGGPGGGGMGGAAAFGPAALAGPALPGGGELPPGTAMPGATDLPSATDLPGGGPAGLDGAGLDGAGLDGAGLDGAGLDGAGLDGAGLTGAGGSTLPSLSGTPGALAPSLTAPPGGGGLPGPGAPGGFVPPFLPPFTPPGGGAGSAAAVRPIGGAGGGFGRAGGIGGLPGGSGSGSLPQAAQPVTLTSPPGTGTPPATPVATTGPAGAAPVAGGGVPPMMPPMMGGAGGGGRPGQLVPGAIRRSPAGRKPGPALPPGLPTVLSGKTGKTDQRVMPARSRRTDAERAPEPPMTASAVVDEDLWRVEQRLGQEHA